MVTAETSSRRGFLFAVAPMMSALPAEAGPGRPQIFGSHRSTHVQKQVTLPHLEAVSRRNALPDPIRIRRLRPGAMIAWLPYGINEQKPYKTVHNESRIEWVWPHL